MTQYYSETQTSGIFMENSKWKTITSTREFRPGKNYSIYGDNCVQRRLELRLSCAAVRQSVVSQPLGAICAEIPWFGTTLAEYPEPRDRGRERVRTRKCGN